MSEAVGNSFCQRNAGFSFTTKTAQIGLTDLIDELQVMFKH